MTYHSSDPLTVARILDLVTSEVRNVRSNAELKTRLAKLGFGFRDTLRGRMLTTMPHGIEITPMPSRFAAF